MSKRFEQMVVLITGGGTGIGRVTALAFGAEGANVVIGGLEDDELERTRVELTDNGVDARASRVDVRDHGDVARFVSEAAEAFGHLDVLVNSHAKTDEVEGFVTITGGKGTTLRGMAEVCADMICRKLGVQTECHTREVVLLPTPSSTPREVTVQTETERKTGAAGTMTPATETRRFRVFRFKRGDERPHHETFDVPVGPRTTVLEALRWIQVRRDRTLALRHSCLHASCGTCGVRVNGREGLACVTMVHDLGREVSVEPIANIPVLTDLVVDMREFYARFPDEHPIVRESEFLDQADTPEGIERYGRYEDCIECGLCLSACPVVVTAERYAGPAALAYAERVLEEPRGAETANLLAWADDPDGVWRCHAIFECTEACPSGVNPAARIMSLRGSLLGRRLRAQRRSEATE